jgi:hypothetical protein
MKQLKIGEICNALVGLCFLYALEIICYIYQSRKISTRKRIWAKQAWVIKMGIRTSGAMSIISLTSLPLVFGLPR